MSAEPSLPRRVPKPWGEELIWALTDRYCGKLITIETGRRLSLQYHEQKDEAIFVTSGRIVRHHMVEFSQQKQSTKGIDGEMVPTPPRSSR